MNMQREISAGAIAGLAAGALLSAWWIGGRKLGITGPSLPGRVEQWAEDQTGYRPHASQQANEGAALGGHLAISTALGALFGALRGGGYMKSLTAGPLFGLGLYALTVSGIGNVLGITRAAHRESGNVLGKQLFEHALFGTATALVADEVRHRL